MLGEGDVMHLGVLQDSSLVCQKPRDGGSRRSASSDKGCWKEGSLVFPSQIEVCLGSVLDRPILFRGKESRRVVVGE